MDLPEINFHKEELGDKKLLIDFLLTHGIDFEYLPYTKAYLQTVIRINKIPQRDSEHLSFSKLPKRIKKGRNISQSRSSDQSAEKINFDSRTSDSNKFQQKADYSTGSKKKRRLSPEDSDAAVFETPSKTRVRFNHEKNGTKSEDSDKLSRSQRSVTPSKTSQESESLKTLLLGKSTKLESKDLLSSYQERNAPQKTDLETRNLNMTPPKRSVKTNNNGKVQKVTKKSKQQSDSAKRDLSNIVSTADSSKSLRSSDRYSSRSPPQRDANKLYGSNKKLHLELSRSDREIEERRSSFDRGPIIESAEENVIENLPITPNLSMRSSLELIQHETSKELTGFESFGSIPEKMPTSHTKYSNPPDSESKDRIKTPPTKFMVSDEEEYETQKDQIDLTDQKGQLDQIEQTDKIEQIDKIDQKDQKEDHEIKNKLLDYLSSLLGEEQNEEELISNTTKETKYDDNIKIEDMSRSNLVDESYTTSKIAETNATKHQNERITPRGEEYASEDSKPIRELVLGSFLSESEKNFSLNRKTKKPLGRKTSPDNVNKKKVEPPNQADLELKAAKKREELSKMKNNGRDYLMTLRARYGNKYLKALERPPTSAAGRQHSPENRQFSPEDRQSYTSGLRSSPDRQSNSRSPSKEKNNSLEISMQEKQINALMNRIRMENYSRKISPDKYINRKLALEVEKRSKDLLLGKFDSLTTEDLALYHEFLLDRAKKQYIEHIRTKRILSRSPSRSPNTSRESYHDASIIFHENISQDAR